MDRRRHFSKTILAERERFVRMWMCGLSFRSIAQLTGATATTVSRWVRRWYYEGSLYSKKNFTPQSHITQANDAALATLVKSVVTHELSDCLLVVMWDAAMKGSSVVAIVTTFPNVKQVVEVGGWADSGLEGVVWNWGGLCRAYILLLADPTPLLHQASKAPHDHWDYRGRWVIVGLKRDQLEALSLTTKGRKTDHLVGIVKTEDDSGHYEVLHNLLYNHRILERVLSYQSNSVLYSSKIYPDIHITDGSPSKNNNSLRHKVMGQYILPHNITSVNQQSTVFPEKTRDLKGTIISLVVFNIPPNVMLRNKLAEGQEDRYFGLDVQVVRALAGLFNFTLQYIEPQPGERWGHQLDNGSWNGMVGLLGRGEGDIGVGVLYVTSLGGRQEFQEYSAPYDNEVNIVE
ncbi:hypothetical protein Pcinc_006663 [Petrolisthes cinctipes]|uniref:Ionotropic glutamate receptor L-glutamate and glycine-binding domain-containing protein n=1 Tax=Petrolisthes cinctipes TaxID=88211 RepID=A0AAE1GCH8_PETCI|nr:hypothetical protein Pcinc_006663 [Petrolisthes cinctipes]